MVEIEKVARKESENGVEADIIESQFNYGVVGSEKCAEMGEKILLFLHQKDLISNLEISNTQLKDKRTLLVALEEELDEQLLANINQALTENKEFGTEFKFVRINAHNGSRESEEVLFGQGYEMEVAENVATPTRKAVLLQKGNLDFLNDQSENQALTKAKLLATDASLSAWLKQERSKHNEYLRLIA